MTDTTTNPEIQRSTPSASGPFVPHALRPYDEPTVRVKALLRLHDGKRLRFAGSVFDMPAWIIEGGDFNTDAMQPVDPATALFDAPENDGFNPFAGI